MAAASSRGAELHGGAQSRSRRHRRSYTPAMPAPDRVRLVVLFGGQSAEHEVSCVSAFHVLRAADPERYDLEPVGITRDGEWVRADDARAPWPRAEGPAALAATARSRPTGTAIEPLPTVVPARRTTCPWSCSRCSTAPWARTAPCRGCSSWPACPTSAPACSARRCAWTR